MTRCIAGFLIAALSGLAVGLEREWSGHATGPAARFAGLRTFFLLGLLGGAAGLLIAQGLTGPAAAILAGGAGLAVAAYVVAARRPGADPDAAEPVGALLATLESDAGSSIDSARSFSARLSDLSGGRVDVTVRRVHRERRHALTVDLWGSWTKAAAQDLIGSISERLPVVRSTMTKFQYL